MKFSQNIRRYAILYFGLLFSDRLRCGCKSDGNNLHNKPKSIQEVQLFTSDHIFLLTARARLRAAVCAASFSSMYMVFDVKESQ